METSSQLHHDLILPSDEGADQSLGDMEGLLSSRHKQLLLKVRTVCRPTESHPVLQCLAKKESCKFTQAEAANGRDTEVEPLHQPGERERILRRLQSEKFIQSHNLARLSHSGEPRHVTSRHEILPCQLIISMIELAKEILFI